MLALIAYLLGAPGWAVLVLLLCDCGGCCIGGGSSR